MVPRRPTINQTARQHPWINQAACALTVDGLEAGRYSYDWQLQRVSRTAGGSTVEYVLDDKLVLQELDGAHSATRRYHFGALSPLGVSDSAGGRWLLNDGLGSVSDEVTPSGGLHRQRQYNAWGEYRNSTAPAVNEPKLGYEGHQYDPETSLTYARARYLDNRYGVLLSRDAVEGSLSDAPSLHRYTWARVNPMRYLDFEGKCFFEDNAIGCFVDAYHDIKQDLGLEQRMEPGVDYQIAGVTAPVERWTRTQFDHPERAVVQAARNESAVVSSVPRSQLRQLAGWQQYQTGASYELYNRSNEGALTRANTEAFESIGGHDVGMAVTGEGHQLQVLSDEQRLRASGRGFAKLAETAIVLSPFAAAGVRTLGTKVLEAAGDRIGTRAIFVEGFEEGVQQYARDLKGNLLTTSEARLAAEDALGEELIRIRSKPPATAVGYPVHGPRGLTTSERDRWPAIS